MVDSSYELIVFVYLNRIYYTMGNNLQFISRGVYFFLFILFISHYYIRPLHSVL